MQEITIGVSVPSAPDPSREPDGLWIAALAVSLGGNMDSKRPTGRRPELRLGASLVALAFALWWTASAWASMPAGRISGPELIAPPADATVSESGLRFAWKAPAGT